MRVRASGWLIACEEGVHRHLTSAQLDPTHGLVRGIVLFDDVENTYSAPAGGAAGINDTTPCTPMVQWQYLPRTAEVLKRPFGASLWLASTKDARREPMSA